MFRKLYFIFLFFIATSLNAQMFNFQGNWNLMGALENNITMNQFDNDNITSIWKWSDNSWQIWSPNSNVMDLVKNYGLKSMNEIYNGEGFWINSKNSFSLNAMAMCPTTLLPIATVSSDYQTGGYSIYDFSSNTSYKALNSYSIGGDDRSYYYNGYIFVVDAPNSGNLSTWYVYKVGKTYDVNSATMPVANYNIDRQNPHSIAFANINKAYLTTYFDNSILIFNPLTGATLGTIDLTSYLYASDNGTKNKYIGAEHMVIYKDKLFVTLDRARTFYGDVQPDKSMILVINLKNDTVEKSIEVSYAPRSPQVYKNYLYFVSMGDYSAPIGKIFRINLSTYTVDNNFIVSSVTKSDSSIDYIKNFVISPQGELFFVANSGWGKPYNVYEILNIDLYNDSAKKALIETPIYSSDGFVADMAYYCGNVVLADRGSASGLVFISKTGTKKITDTELGYPPYKIGTDFNY